MTILGPDLASYEEGLDLSTLTDAEFVIVKATQGSGYVDPFFKGWIAQAKALNKLPIWYHFLTTDASPAAQAAHIKANVDPSLPGMADFEPTNGSQPTLPFLVQFIDACIALDLRLKLSYLPRWYWSQLGSPSLSSLYSRGVRLVSSAYPGASGTGPNQYEADGGDNGEGWVPYTLTDEPPLIWQFTDRAAEGGQLVDYNAFKGTIAQLAEFLDEPVPAGTPTPPPPSNPYAQIQQGSRGDAVITLQRLLNKHGYGLGVDGDFGPETDRAVRAYQFAHSLHVDGQVGKDTWGSLLAGQTGTTYPGTELKYGSTGALVRRVQQQLLNRGYDIGSSGVDGNFGKDTRAAVESFQKVHKLQVDGIVGVHTWGALFN
jgi:peptidoglycan hydrolase-like protein with peptidoglycan-binding domain